MTRTLVVSALSALAAVCMNLNSPAARADEVIVCGWDEVFVLEAGAQGFSTNKVWSWKATESPGLPVAMHGKFKTTDDCKPVDGGRNVLISSSGGAVALVERATKKTLFYGAVGNAHSVEMLPNGRVAVAGSRHAQGNCVALFDINEPDRIIHSITLDSGHGVVWDEARKTLWALGYDKLLALRLNDWETAQPRLEVVRVHEVPGKSGHDLVPVPGSNELVVTTDDKVLLFDRDRHTFRPHPGLGKEARVKSVSIHPRTGQIFYIQAEGTDWWAGRLRMLNPAGQLALPGERLYKARLADFGKPQLE